MSAIGGSAQYRFKRQIRLPKREPLVEMTYSLVNEGDEPLPCYWCAHPLLAVEPDTSISIQGSMPLRVDDAVTRQHVAADVEQHWPKLLLRDGKSFDLSQSFTVNGAQRSFASKIFVRSPETGVASVLLGGNGARLTFRFDPAELPWLGIWINNHAWSGCGSEPYTNLGIEPATTPYDCVNQAIENDAVPWLQPGGIRNWSLSVELQA
jgi:galactose mutarotase-like enzyme